MGQNYGAVRFTSLGGFYDAQREAAEAVIRGIHGVACASWSERTRNAVTPASDLHARIGAYARDYDRPHHTFTVDGPRGSGKTTLLQTLAGFLSLMRLDCELIRPGNDDERRIRDELRSLRLSAPGEAGGRRAALVLPIVFTEDMDPLETTMEAVFAQMEIRLDEESAFPGADATVLSELRNDLRREVGVAWTFSQRIGAEALSQDALDYGDFVERRADYNRRAYSRIGTWRRFVDRYLDLLGYELLVPLFDDSDLNPDVAEDILRSIRMYFSHPRIATVLAVEVDNLAWTLFARGLANEHRSLAVLQAVDAGIRNGFVAQVDANAEALVDKILPMNLRFDLRPTSLRHIDHFFRSDDCGLGAATASFEDWCRIHHRAAADPDDRFGWFLLGGPYRRLVSGNVRQVVAFRDATAQPDSKPLRAILRVHTMRDLSQRVSRNITELDWLIESGQLEPGWPEGGEEDGEESFTEAEVQFADLYVDIKIAQSALEVQGSALLRHWLPDGLFGDPTPRELRDDAKRLGVAGRLREEPLPRSCLYIHQLRRLSGVAFAELPPPSLWALWLVEIGYAPGEERLLRLRGAAGDVAEIGAGSDADVLGWFALRIKVLREAGRAASPQFEGDASGFAVALYAITRPSVTTRATFALALKAVADGSEDEDLDVFLAKLAEAVRKSERQRQEATFTWAAALELAEAGEDNQRVERPQPRSSLAVSLVATAPRSRFQELVDQTASVLRRRDRHAVLLAWSLCPLLRPIHDFGLDYDDRSPGQVAWTKLSEAFTGLVDDIVAADTGIDAAAATLSGPGDDWTYADMPSGGQGEIAAALGEARDLLKRDLRPEDAAGVLRARRKWQTWPKQRDVLIASVLGTSLRWARENVVSAT